MSRSLNRALDPAELWLPLVVVAGGVAVAAAAQIQALLVLVLLAGLILMVGVWPRRRKSLPELFLYALGLALTGYSVIGRGFAHLGVYPVYMGEAVLAIGFAAVVFGGGVRPALRSPLTWLLIAFMILGALGTIPYFGEYGMVALRDAVTWGYGIFAILVCGFVLRSGWFIRIVRSYRYLVPLILISTPIMIALEKVLNYRVPVPGFPGVHLFDASAGPMALHMAGVAVYVMLGLHRRDDSRARSGLLDWAFWGVWIVGFGMAAILNRGGMLAALGAMVPVLLFRPNPRWAKGAFIGLCALSVLFLFDIRLDLQKRVLSSEQVIDNINSILGQETQKKLANTRDWRLRWWEQIRDYTVYGPYFWTGKGYGINLASSDGIILNFDNKEGPPLRSPHNGHMTVLARSGVPGLLLWVVLQGTFGISLFLMYRRAKARGLDWWSRVDLWILAYWLGFLINMSFTVYLESPHGGIWFWSIFGFGIAALQIQRRLLELRAEGPLRRRASAMAAA